MRIQRLVFCTSLAISAAACGSGASTIAPAASTASTVSTASTKSTAEVVVQNYTFPAIATTPGATITLVNRDAEPHTVTADGGAFRIGPFDSKSPGQLIAPAKAGTYAFHCEIHPTMHGNLVVNNP